VVTGDAPRCFGCGGRFEQEQLEDVGDTVFCRACLGRMLRRVDERGASVAGKQGANGLNGVNGANGLNGTKPAGGTSVARTPPADAPCFVCGEPLEGSAFVELRGFAICVSCSRGLVGDDPPIVAEASSAAEASVADEASGDDPTRRAGLRVLLAQGIETPGSGTEWCSGCGRAMPGPGSYQLVDGRPHCAACVAARPPIAPRIASPVAPAAPGADDTCDACRRAVTSGALRETRGFGLCVACRESDPALALALAQARHRRRLERAGRRILRGGDDD
jgi:formylmethanofuran dehydrogenase subunit E